MPTSKPPKVPVWEPKSPTTVGRLVYHLKALPNLVVAQAVFHFHDQDGTWKPVYSRGLRQEAWEELLDLELKDLKSLSAIEIPNSSLVDRLIVPSEGLDDATLAKLVPREIPLWTEKTIGQGKQSLKCTIVSMCRLTSSDKKFNLYRKTLDILVRERIGTEKVDFMCVEEASVKTTIDPLVPAFEKSLLQETPSPSRKIPQYRTLLHCTPSLDAKRSLLKMDFDLAAITTTYDKTVVDLLQDVFGASLSEKNLKRMEDLINHLLIGLYVFRGYEQKPNPNTSARTRENWKTPFQICKIKMYAEIKDKKDFNHLAHYKNNYNGGKELKYSYLPFAGDNSGGWFPLEALKLATKPLPPNEVLSPVLKSETIDLSLLKDDIGKPMMIGLGNKIFQRLIKPAAGHAPQLSDPVTEYEPPQSAQPLFGVDTKAEPYHVECMDPIDFAFGPCQHKRWGSCSVCRR